MRAFTLFIALLFGGLAAAQTGNPEALVQDAINKQKAGDLEGAIREYKEFLKSSPRRGPHPSKSRGGACGAGTL